jgi:hypothetical protein
VRFRLYQDYKEPTTRHRGINVYKHLQSIGIDADSWDGSETADVIVLQYDTRDTNVARGLCDKLVLDCNDFIFIDGHPERDMFFEDYSMLDYVTTGSKWLGRLIDNVCGLPNSHVPEAADTSYDSVKRNPSNELTIFWMGMHMNISYFQTIDPVLEKLSREHDFTVVFCCPEYRQDGVSNIDIAKKKKYKNRLVNWTFENAIAGMSTANIGVCPLYQNIWCWCKCASKAAIFMRHGLPVVATDTESYQNLIEHGKSGFLAFSPEDWYSPLDRLLSSEKLRNKMGEEGKKRSRELYSIDKIGKIWIDTLERIVSL